MVDKKRATEKVRAIVARVNSANVAALKSYCERCDVRPVVFLVRGVTAGDQQVCRKCKHLHDVVLAKRTRVRKTRRA